jgi:hypothetical protein
VNTSKATILVSGALANKPHNGGNAWTRLSWARGFRRLGFNVVFVEQLAAGADEPKCRDYFRTVMAASDLAGSSSLLDASGVCVEGMTADRVVDAARSADVLFNISGHCRIDPIRRGPRLRVYFDDDPGYTQFWHAGGHAGPGLDGHDFYYTVGMNVGSPDCPIPVGGIPWRHTRPPVVLDDWPVAPPAVRGERLRFTTVASWRGPYGPVTHQGRTYGLKVHEFRKCIDLPRRVDADFELALDIHPNEVNDLALLRDNGWRLTDPGREASTPEAFRAYVRNSSAEFSVAQGIYVDTHSGWFSDRTTRYLASGRPALVQDTGFTRHLPCGGGLVPFRDVEEAAAGVRRILADYPGHCAAARAVAERCFDSDVVLGRLLDEWGVGA